MCVCASSSTIVLIQISPIRSLTLALSLSLCLSPSISLHPTSLPAEGEIFFSFHRRHVRDTFEWTFNRLVMYCNRFVASLGIMRFASRAITQGARIRNEISLYLQYLYRYIAPSLSFSLSSRLYLRSVSRRGWENFHRRLWKSTGNLDIRVIARMDTKRQSSGYRDRSVMAIDVAKGRPRDTIRDECPLILSLPMTHICSIYVCISRLYILKLNRA